MKNGIDYMEYVEGIRRKVEAWDIVTGCFAFPSSEFSSDVRGYFDSLEEIFDAAWPDCSADEAKGVYPVEEEKCVENIKHAIQWLQKEYVDIRAFDDVVEKRQLYYRRIVKNLERALKHKFGVVLEEVASS